MNNGIRIADGPGEGGAVSSGPSPAPRGLPLRPLRWAVAVLAMMSIAAVLLCAALRVTYPFELEWMEGGVLDHITRVEAGQPIYVEPSFDFVPFIYPPLYYYLSAAATWITGGGFLGPRLVSLAASLGCMAVIFLLVRKETGDKLAALAAAALFAGTYAASGRWFDIARIDSLFLLFALAGATVIRLGNGRWSAVAAGLLLAGGMLTKQSTLIFAAPLLLFCLIYQPRRFVPLAATFFVVSAMAFGYLHWQSGGWSTYYLFVLPRTHPINHYGHYRFWRIDLLGNVSHALGMIAVLVMLRFRGWRLSPTAAFYTALAAAGLATSYFSRLHDGGYANVLLPVYAVIAVLFGLAIAYLPRLVPERGDTGPIVNRKIEAVVAVAVMLQLIVLNSNPLGWVPRGGDRRAGTELTELIGRFEGNVIVPTASYLAERAGKPGMAHYMAINDVLRADTNEPVRRKLLAEVRQRLGDPANDALLLPDVDTWLPGVELPEEFVCVGDAVDGAAFRPKSGATEYVPRRLFVRDRLANSPQWTPAEPTRLR